ncbi:hypothetical protein [Bradyrhizobium tunisiense]|uniref:hypothetical protein n=1 Tax=Bradyrhizobium tunisiense TaxID=3278709 RepID=UPI0035D8FA5D
MVLSDSYFYMNGASAARPYMPPSGVLEIFKAEFDSAYSDGGLFLLTMHPHVIGHRSRLQLLDALIAYIKRKEDVWFATHEHIARYVKEAAGLR